MSSEEKDYIMRQIEQAGAALRRLRSRLGIGAAAAEEIVHEAEAAQSELLGPVWPVARAVDVDTAGTMVRDSRQLEVWAALLGVQAEALRLLGDHGRATDLEERAKALIRSTGAQDDALE